MVEMFVADVVVVVVKVVVGGQTYARMASSCFPSGLGAYYLRERSACARERARFIVELRGRGWAEVTWRYGGDQISHTLPMRCNKQHASSYRYHRMGVSVSVGIRSGREALL